MSRFRLFKKINRKKFIDETNCSPVVTNMFVKSLVFPLAIFTMSLLRARVKITPVREKDFGMAFS